MIILAYIMAAVIGFIIGISIFCCIMHYIGANLCNISLYIWNMVTFYQHKRKSLLIYGIIVLAFTFLAPSLLLLYGIINFDALQNSTNAHTNNPLYIDFNLISAPLMIIGYAMTFSILQGTFFAYNLFVFIKTLIQKRRKKPKITQINGTNDTSLYQA